MSENSVRAGKLTLRGESIAARTTYIVVPELRLALDLGRARVSNAKMPLVLISHGHADHIGALHGHVITRQRRLRLPPAHYVLPHAAVESAKDALRAYLTLNAGSVERANRNFPIFQGIAPDAWIKLDGDLECRAIATAHTVPSVGYCIYRVTHKLAPEFRGLRGAKLAELRAQGVELTQESRAPILAYSGDTLLSALLRDADAMRAETLLLECTFLRGDREQAHARLHTCEEDIADAAPHFHCAHLVLFHFSERYDAHAIDAAVARLNSVLGIPVHALK